MIKKFHEIILKDIIVLDATKSAGALKSHWYIPLFLCKDELESLAKQIFEAIGGKTVEGLEDQFDRLYAYRKLQIYEALHKAVEIEIGLKARINAWKIIIGKDFTESPQLEKVLSEVERITGIKIETPDDLKTFNDWIQHKVDKYAEMYPQEEVEEKTETPLIDIFYSVFNYMGEPFNDRMLLIAFLGMKKMAEDRIAKQSNTEENGGE